MGKFRKIAPDVFPMGIELDALSDWVEDPIERGCIGATSGGPLPTVGITGDITIA